MARQFFPRHGCKTLNAAVTASSRLAVFAGNVSDHERTNCPLTQGPIFTKPSPGTFNTQRVHDLIYRPGYQNWNPGLFKDLAISNRAGSSSAPRPLISSTIRIGAAVVGCNGTTNIGLDPNNLNAFGKVLTKGAGVGGGERNLLLSLRFYF
jgi:hypothetical protein